MEDILNSATPLISALRNSVAVDQNWPAFRKLIENNLEDIVSTFSIRWLVSVCDTYADYGSGEQKRNALLISMFVNMLRMADTAFFVSSGIDEENLEKTNDRLVMQYDGVATFAINRQDVFLNLSKRTMRATKNDPVFGKIWKEIISRIHNYDNAITKFKSMSKVPHRYFPLNATEMPDNYGVV
ncbi:MAG: hypothetical protein C0617_13245 [Desulfuromonas sp.]|uniref:hypothetical protein n=1 Tax=Desulfuromonas sp. TaxID=892 RepID=UPI000CBB4E16|nr:hypothetical protein [Desulfuromonas sp.]PLX82831.1 MAG: hypothetical protein C0617_13245 [Desulfuromonas sp.]